MILCNCRWFVIASPSWSFWSDVACRLMFFFNEVDQSVGASKYVPRSVQIDLEGGVCAHVSPCLHHVHNEAHLFCGPDTLRQDWKSIPAGHLPYRRDWCVSAVYTEGNSDDHTTQPLLMVTQALNWSIRSSISYAGKRRLAMPCRASK